MSDGIVLLICLVIIVIFIGIIIYWLVRNSKPYTINDSVKGLYDYAQLGQLCLVGATGTSTGQDSLLLPGYFQPQNCDSGLACIPIKNNSEYGYCKSKVGNYCTNIYDCAPPEFAGGSGTEVYCSGSICTSQNLGVLFSACGGTTGTTGPIGLQCDTIDLNLICSNGTCLGNLGFDCTSQNQCAGGLFCDTNTNQCIAPIQPAQLCDGDYCTSGFGCTGGVCEPLIPISGTNLFTAPQPGSKGAFCIQGTSVSAPYACDSGLICSIDTFLNGPTTGPGVPGIFAGVTGFGLCDIPVKQGGSTGSPGGTCYSQGGACIPPLVCYNGFCQAPINGATQDINYCGPGSSEICDLTGLYTCVSNMCQPNISGLCNGGTGFCNTGSCTGNKLGIFSLDRSGITGATQIGTWQYLDLPVGEVAPTNQSTISTFQNMEIDINGNPITKTKCIYYPYYMSSSPYFWLAEFESGSTGSFTVSSNWTQYNITNTGGTNLIEGIKYTQGGNVTLKYSLASDVNHLSDVLIFNGYTSGNIDFSTPSLGPIEFGISTFQQRVIDWDVDDVFNKAIVGLFYSDLGATANAIYGALPTISGLYAVNNNWPISGINTATWCRYFINDGGANINNFMVGIDNTIQSQVLPSPYIIITLGESQSTGAGFFSTFSNYYSKLELYYVSDRSFRYVNSINAPTQTSEDLPIEGYTPDYTQKSTPCPLPTPTISINYVSTLSMGNIDSKLFSLVTICE